MFEDLIPTDETKETLYICPKAKVCNADFCLHKHLHGKTELGRPDQPETEKPCDCSVHECKYFIRQKGKTVCVPALRGNNG